jgi:hypothetical protein
MAGFAPAIHVFIVTRGNGQKDQDTYKKREVRVIKFAGCEAGCKKVSKEVSCKTIRAIQ